jgi:hypothetical protein
MCERSSRSIPHPRWGWLYGVTLSPLAVLAVVEAATPPTVFRSVLRYALALTAVAGMTLWLRANRAAFDLQAWCDCASATVTLRVIESRRPAVADRAETHERGPAWADAERELVPR